MKNYEVEHIHGDGRIIWAEFHMTFIRDAAGNAGGILGITSDITDRKIAEEALRRARKSIANLLKTLRQGFMKSIMRQAGLSV